MLKILISNDDGIDSPTLVPLVKALQPLGEVRVAVPDSERSWIGKAISRFDTVTVQQRTIDGIPMLAVNGSPADCVSLGVYSLFADRPDLVVSGINLGLNFGLAFLVSSGTVGAALEGWISGVPSIAISMAIPNDAYGLTGSQRIDALGDRPTAAAAVSAEIVDTIWRQGFPDDVDLFSVNMPADANLSTPRKIARVTRSRYGQLFVPGPEKGYLHRFSSLSVLEQIDDGDMQVVARGEVAISPLRLNVSGSVPATLATALTKR